MEGINLDLNKLVCLYDFFQKKKQTTELFDMKVIHY